VTESVSLLFSDDFQVPILALKISEPQATIEKAPPFRPSRPEVTAALEGLSDFSVLLPRSEETSGRVGLKAAEKDWERQDFGSKTVITQPLTDVEETFRHSHWRHRRHLTYALLSAPGICSSNRLASFAHCGSAAFVQHSAIADRYKVRGTDCHDRWCEPCMRSRAGRIAASLRKLAKGQHCRFLTLTQAHTSEPLRDQLDRLRKDFATLRHLKEWKAHVTAGAVVTEIKLSKSGEWHPHLHCLITGTFWDQAEIKALWKKVTGTSWIVDIRDCGDDDGTGASVAYLTGYISKPAKAGPIWENQHRFLEMMGALKGRRMIDLLGAWRGKINEDDDDDPDPGDWVDVGSVESIWKRARDGQRWALAVLASCNKHLFTDPPTESDQLFGP